MRIERIVSPVSVTTVCLQHNLLAGTKFVIQNRRNFVTRVTKTPGSVKPDMSYVDYPRCARTERQEPESASDKIPVEANDSVVKRSKARSCAGILLPSNFLSSVPFTSESRPSANIDLTGL